MNLLRYLLLMCLCAVGTATILMEIALTVDGEITAFTQILLLILSSIITLWFIRIWIKNLLREMDQNAK